MQLRLPETPAVCGQLRLGFACDQARQYTQLVRHEQVPPLQAVRAFPLTGGGTLLHLHNLSGGVLGGDQLVLDVDAGPRSYVQLTTTSATRLYRARPGLPPARQSSRIRVQEGSVLEYLPDPLIPFAGSRYQQETRIELAADAGLFWWEVVAPGRSARGEIFDYHLLEMKLAILACDQPVAREQIKLEPALRPLTSPARLGSYQYFASFYICRTGLPATRWSELEQRLSDVAQELTRPGEIIWGVSSLAAHGLVVRGLSQQGRHINDGLLKFWRAAKMELYGEQVQLPRKVY